MKILSKNATIYVLFLNCEMFDISLVRNLLDKFHICFWQTKLYQQSPSEHWKFKFVYDHVLHVKRVHHLYFASSILPSEFYCRRIINNQMYVAWIEQSFALRQIYLFYSVKWLNYSQKSQFWLFHQNCQIALIVIFFYHYFDFK